MAFAYEIIVLLSYFGFVLCMLWILRDENGFVKHLEQRNAKVDDASEEEEETQESTQETGKSEESDAAQEESGETEETQEGDDTDKTDESEKIEELRQVETEAGVEAKEEEESSTLRQRHVDVITTEL